MVAISCPVKYDSVYACSLCLLSQQLACAFSSANLAGAIYLHPFTFIAHTQERNTKLVVNQLGVDVLEGSINHQPWALGGTSHLATNPQVPPVAKLLP
jgi:hypothetical protein